MVSSDAKLLNSDSKRFDKLVDFDIKRFRYLDALNLFLIKF